MNYQTYKKTVDQAREQAIAELKRRRDARTNKVVAVELGISAPYLSDLVNGRRDLTEELLKELLK